jgi:hypothetical protein
MLALHQLHQVMERLLIQPLRSIDSPDVIDNDRHRRAFQRRRQLGEPRTLGMDLQVPADCGQFLREGHHVVDGEGGHVSHVVEAHATKALALESLNFLLRSGRSHQRDAYIVL